MGKNIRGNSLLFRKWIPFYKFSQRALSKKERYVITECWHFAIDSGITEVKSLMRCVYHFMLIFLEDYDYPKDLSVFVEIIVILVHSIIGQNKEDEIDFTYHKRCDGYDNPVKYQMILLQYPIHKFLMYLDKRTTFDYEKEIEDIQFFYLQQTGEYVFPKYLLGKLYDNYISELVKVSRVKTEEDYTIDESHIIPFRSRK